MIEAVEITELPNKIKSGKDVLAFIDEYLEAMGDEPRPVHLWDSQFARVAAGVRSSVRRGGKPKHVTWDEFSRQLTLFPNGTKPPIDLYYRGCLLIHKNVDPT